MPNCSSCHRSMVNIAGLGSSEPDYICENSSCLSHYQDASCPTCKSKPSNVQILGIGDRIFTCRNGHEWA